MVGVPDPDLGESVVAFVVTEPGRDVGDASLRQACEASLARFKHPRRYVRLGELPRNAMGKVLAADLRVRLVPVADGDGPGGVDDEVPLA